MTIDNNTIYWAKVRPNAIIPTKTDENAGYDIYACTEKTIYIPPLETVLIPTGIAAAVSEDYYLQVQERGSTGKLGMKYSAGVIDSSYRGEIFIAITNTSNKYLYIDDDSELETLKYIPKNKVRIYPKDKAIAQLVVHKVPKLGSREITYEELQSIPSNRGIGKLGSSGK